MSNKICIFLCLILWLPRLAAQKISVAQFDPSEWGTAPYSEIFKDVDITYAVNPQKAYEILDIIIQRANNDQQYKWLYKAYYAKASYLERQLSFQKALDYYILAAKLIEKKDNKVFVSTQIDIAVMYRNLYRYSEARTVYVNLIEHGMANRDSATLTNAYGGLGVLFFTVNDYENAIRYYDKALQKTREMRNYVDECVYLDNLSEAYGCQKKYDKAFIHIDLACRIAEKENDLESKIPLYERYARLYADVGDFDKAFAKIDTALALCKDDEHLRDRNNLTIAKAELYLKQPNPEAALTTFKTINEKLINVNSLTKVFYELGKINEDRNDLNAAENYYVKSQKLADANKSLRYNEWSHRALYRIYRRKNQAPEALFNLERANLLQDSLFNYEKSGQVTELQFHYDLAQSDQKLQEAQLKANRNMSLVGGLVGLLTISFLLFGYYWQRKRNDVLKLKNEVIREKKKQLEVFNNEILTKNKAIEEQKRLLEESNTMLQQFNYAVAHDLKEPLRNINSFANIIQRKYINDMPPTAASYFGFVTTGAARMGKMLDGLLRFSMMSMDQITDLETVNIGAIINEVKENLNRVIDERNAQIIYTESSTDLYINRIHITQLMQNLVSNALKFVEVTPIIEIGSREEKDNVLLFVKDNGIGISPENGKGLFHLFHRLHRDSSQFEGTGVGLALCKNIVEKYNGRIWFESVEGHGTTFFMQFPKVTMS